MAEGFLSVTIQDILGVQATHVIPLNLDGTQTVDDVGSEFNTYLPLLDAVTDGKILDARFVWNIDLPGGLKAAPAPDRSVQLGMLQTWTQANIPATPYDTLVPDLAAALVNNTTGKIDVTNAAYLAWRGHLLGLVGPAITFVSNVRNAITGQTFVTITFRNHRRRTRQLSRERS